MELPITQVGIITDKSRPPYSFSVIDKSCDAAEDADLWRDGIFRRTYRYLCVARENNCQTVLVGLQLINDRETPPTGFVALDLTLDTNEKATKKKTFCVKFVPRSSTKSAITDISIFSKQKRMPPGFTLVSELNNLLIAYKSVTLANDSTPVNPTPMPNNNYNTVNKGDEYSKVAVKRTTTATNPLCGVPFNLSKKFSCSSNSSLKSFQNFDLKDAAQIYNQYTYNFGVENSVLRDQ